MKYILFLCYFLWLVLHAEEVKFQELLKTAQNNVIENALIVVQNQDEKNNRAYL
jgi:hypothetical protein